ncbi:MAG: hypothetical protein KDK02_18270 [Rhodobacteraceae bacterium]|nr:hypothetical protein [Paracoccaceae bacterium]
MSASNVLRVRRLAAILSLLLFALFAGNIVLSKLASVMNLSVTLLPPLWEFLVLHAATITGVIFLFCEERIRNARPRT